MAAHQDKVAQHRLESGIPLFPGPSDLTPQPYPSAPVYQPGINTHNMDSTDNSLLTPHPTLPPTVKVLPSSTYPDMRSLSPRARKQRSRNKLQEYYDAPDLDFEELERSMQVDERTRSVRRQR